MAGAPCGSLGSALGAAPGALVGLGADPRSPRGASKVCARAVLCSSLCAAEARASPSAGAECPLTASEPCLPCPEGWCRGCGCAPRLCTPGPLGSPGSSCSLVRHGVIEVSRIMFSEFGTLRLAWPCICPLRTESCVSLFSRIGGHRASVRIFYTRVLAICAHSRLQSKPARRKVRRHESSGRLLDSAPLKIQGPREIYDSGARSRC